MLKSLKLWDHVGIRVKFFLPDQVPDGVRGPVSVVLCLVGNWARAPYPTMYLIGYQVG